MIMLAILLPIFLPAGIQAQQPLVLGLYPFVSSAEVYKRFTPLADQLSRELGRPVEIHLESSYDAHLNTIEKGGVDIAYLAPALYVKLTGKIGVIPLLAGYETKNGRTYKGVIVVRRESPIQTLAQLKGKKFAFGDVNSTMGHLVPRYMLLKAGVDVKALGGYDYQSNHDNVALGVLAGTYDAGALREEIYNEYAPQGLRVLALSEPFPEHLIVARRGLPTETISRLSRILFSLKDTEEGRRTLVSMQNSLTALVPVKDADYEPFRRLLATLAQAGVQP